MQKFIIFNKKAQAEVLNSSVTAMIIPYITDGISNNYCDIKKHPTKELYAVVVDPNYIKYFTKEQIDSSVELTEDWFKTTM